MSVTLSFPLLPTGFARLVLCGHSKVSTAAAQHQSHSNFDQVKNFFFSVSLPFADFKPVLCMVIVHAGGRMVCVISVEVWSMGWDLE